MFLLIIVYGYVLVAALVIFFLMRDRSKPDLFFGRHKLIGSLIIAVLITGILTAFYSTLVEPFILRTRHVPVKMTNIQKNIRIAFVADIQAGNHKKTAWVEKISEKIAASQPDLIIIGGDLIDNEGTFEDQSKYLEPLKALADRYSVYYTLGNHEYGIGGTVKLQPAKYTGDRSAQVIGRMRQLGIPLLRNELACPEINQTKICLFGMDDIWKYAPEFSGLKAWTTSTPLILITHNPDGILYYPKNISQPSLILSGHSHGGQIWLPFYGPLGNAQIGLGDAYYRGLNYWHDIPLYTSTGAGESGAPLRLFAPPEIAIIEISP